MAVYNPGQNAQGTQSGSPRATGEDSGCMAQIRGQNMAGEIILGTQPS
jgi:hypothetical protein